MNIAEWTSLLSSCYNGFLWLHLNNTESGLCFNFDVTECMLMIAKAFGKWKFWLHYTFLVTKLFDYKDIKLMPIACMRHV